MKMEIFNTNLKSYQVLNSTDSSLFENSNNYRHQARNDSGLMTDILWDLIIVLIFIAIVLLTVFAIDCYKRLKIKKQDLEYSIVVDDL